MSTALITSLLDNDFYKFTMQHAVVRLFPYAHARYQFINRGNHQYPEGLAAALRSAIDEMAELKLTPDEKKFLQEKCPYLPPTYLDFLNGFRYNPSEVSVARNGSELSVTVEGNWYRTILWEVPLMSLICELYYRLNNTKRLPDDKVKQIVKDKIEHYKKSGIKVADFGTRRRYSYPVHKMVVETLKEYGGSSFTGTSNVSLAMQFGVKPIGTHAHEWFMFHAARYGFKMSNTLALDNWVEVYRGDLGIALSDTYTTPVFFESFDRKFSKLFDGVRHDSGDPIVFAEQTIRHYRSLGIDPLSKTIIFSDGLTPEKVDRIVAYCKGKIGMSFGIGTNFTNDVGVPPMNIVIKMTEARPEGKDWISVIKLSDEHDKNTGNTDMIRLAKKILGID